MAKIQGLFKTLSWNSRTFQGFLAFKDFSRTYSKIQGLFKTVRTLLLIRKPRQTNAPICCAQFPGIDLSKVTSDSSLLNNNPLSNGKRYKIIFNWDVRKIIDKKAQGNKCPSLLQFPGKDLPNVTTDSSLLNNNSLSKGTKLVSVCM